MIGKGSKDKRTELATMLRQRTLSIVLHGASLAGSGRIEMRGIGFAVFIRIYRYLVGKGLGRLPLVGRTVDALYQSLGPQGDAALIEAQGHKMYFDPGDLALPRMLVMYGHYERHATDLFRKLVKPGNIVVDIGAHIGHYSLVAAEIVGKNGRVFSFEPSPDNHAFLIRNIAANGYDNVEAIPKAVSDRTGVTKFFLNLDDTGQHSLSRGEGHGHSLEIETITLDEFLADRDYLINVVKMDVEGAEMRVLQGMRETIARADDLTIFTEFSPPMITRAGSSPSGFLQQLTDYGFHLFHICEKKQSLERIDIARGMQIGAEGKWVNLLCLKDRACEELHV